MSLQHLPALERLVDELSKLPSIGRKSAMRLACHLLSNRPERSAELAEALSGLHAAVKTCSICGGYGESDPCAICSNPRRDPTVVCVVEDATDIFSVERGRSFHGLYHVLGGRLDPSRGVGPESLRVASLCERIARGRRSRKEPAIEEVILATSPSVDGEATARLAGEEIAERFGDKVRVTRIGVGMPIGGDLEYVDDLTLAKALEGRRRF
jgi:recombination protein RecR